ncbi:MAG TPA: alpha/beta hydrolase [Candidatus Binataceae bacterium]|nr:alpha/beta hydrolase [Candidatus Binataceae bacterium]
MPKTKSDVEIYYETRGSSGIPLLFVQGFTWQLIGWREGFCQKFVDRGAFVILYDNRDVGLSQKFGGPDEYDGGYSLEDMATDGFAVLDDLGLASAHVIGASMGGMIAQIMALSQPSRVRSLNLIYTAPSLDMGYFVQPDKQEPIELLGKRFERAEALEKFIERERASASTAYPYDEDWVRELGTRGYDRCYAPEGVLRQLAAMIRWKSTPEALGGLEMPSSIIHGRADGRIKVEAALDLGRLLKTSELHIFPGLGHEIPEPLWDEFATIIMRTAARA